MATWEETIPGYAQMSPDEQRRARDKWNAYIDEKWRPRIEGYDQMSFWDREVAKQTWANNEGLRLAGEKNDAELEGFKIKAGEIEAEQTRRSEALKTEYAARMAEMRRRQEQQQREANNLQALYKSRANALANPQKSVYEGDKAQGFGGGEEGGVGATLLTHRGITGGQKLGGKSRLGGKSLLGV